MGDRSRDASALLGMEGFVVLSQSEEDGELYVLVETTANVAGCPSCGVKATGHGRSVVQVRDLPAGGRPVRLVWRKRRWLCTDPDCDAKSFTEQTPEIEGSATPDRVEPPIMTPRNGFYCQCFDRVFTGLVFPILPACLQSTFRILMRHHAYVCDSARISLQPVRAWNWLPCGFELQRGHRHRPGAGGPHPDLQLVTGWRWNWCNLEGGDSVGVGVGRRVRMGRVERPARGAPTIDLLISSRVHPLATCAAPGTGPGPRPALSGSRPAHPVPERGGATGRRAPPGGRP